MLTIFFRSAFIYVIVLFLYRLMGKRQIGEMQPFELVLTQIIADLATIPMSEISVPVLHGIVPVLCLVLLHFFLTFLSSKSTKFAKFFNGKPIIVINPNGIDEKSLKNLDMSVEDVFEALREAGFFSVEQVQYAVMETNGKLSVLPKSDFAPLTASDMKIKNDESQIPVSMICEGKILKDNLSVLGVCEKDLMAVLKMKKIKKIKDVLLLTIDKNGQVFLQEFGKKCQSFKLEEGEIYDKIKLD